MVSVALPLVCFLLPRAPGAVSACPMLPPVRQAPACGCEPGSGVAGVDFFLPTPVPYFFLHLPPPTTASGGKGPCPRPALQFLQGTVPRLPAARLEVSDLSLCQRLAPRLELRPQGAQLGKGPQSSFQGPSPDSFPGDLFPGEFHNPEPQKNLLSSLSPISRPSSSPVHRPLLGPERFPIPSVFSYWSLAPNKSANN